MIPREYGIYGLHQRGKILDFGESSRLKTPSFISVRVLKFGARVRVEEHFDWGGKSYWLSELYSQVLSNTSPYQAKEFLTDAS